MTLQWCFEVIQVTIKVNLESYQNLRKAQRRWGMVLGVLVKAAVTVQAREMFYKSVVQAVLLYRSDIWVIT